MRRHSFMTLCVWHGALSLLTPHTRFVLKGLECTNTRRLCTRSISISMRRHDSSDPLTEALQTPAINWYPGHIAKAERELSDYLKRVDVVIEMRDARIPQSTTHPKVPEWVGSRPLIVCVTRVDMVPGVAVADWKRYYASHPTHASFNQENSPPVFFIDSKHGEGVLGVRRMALRAGIAVNARREARGIRPRAVRAAIIGFPNVGKSALINRLLGEKLAKSQNLPGVTKQLQWVRIGGTSADTDALELLDSPGIIPPRQVSQKHALRLAICNDIGQASYDPVVAATALLDLMSYVHGKRPSYVPVGLIERRYGVDITRTPGEEAIARISDKRFFGDILAGANKILGDFRKGELGKMALEFPPEDERKRPEQVFFETSSVTLVEAHEDELPNLDVGKGDYEGW